MFHLFFLLLFFQFCDMAYANYCHIEEVPSTLLLFYYFFFIVHFVLLTKLLLKYAIKISTFVLIEQRSSPVSEGPWQLGWTINCL